MKKLLPLLIIVLFLMNCSENTNNTPTLSTSIISNINFNSATSGGTIDDDGGSPVLSNGVCWSTSTLPSTNGNHTNENVNLDTFISVLTDLEDNTTYYVRAFATNAIGTAYGNEESFTTTPNTQAPCSSESNSIVFNSQNHQYTNIEHIKNGLYGDHGLFGSGSISDLRIEFSKAPESGIYTTLGTTSFIGSKECVVSGTFSNNHYVSKKSQSVYVTKYENGDYSMSFCDLEFHSGSSSYSFSSDGNLTTK